MERTMVSSSSTERVFEFMLDNVRSGAWDWGAEIPSERVLIEQYGVSRVALREAISMLRGLGVLEVSHGRRTRVKKIGSEALARLLPLMLASGGQRTFDQIFEARLGVESQSAALAARRRTPEQVERLETLVSRFRAEIHSAEAHSLKIDLEFHMEIARASANPLFPMLLESLAGFVAFAQRESCAHHPERRLRAVMSHEAIFEAIRDGDSERARVEMESHLRYSMTRRIDEPGAEVEIKSAMPLEVLDIEDN